MAFMEHDEPWKVFHGHAKIKERLACPIDQGKAVMSFPDLGKLTMASITGMWLKWLNYLRALINKI